MALKTDTYGCSDETYHKILVKEKNKDGKDVQYAFLETLTALSERTLKVKKIVRYKHHLAPKEDGQPEMKTLRPVQLKEISVFYKIRWKKFGYIIIYLYLCTRISEMKHTLSGE